MSIVRLAALKTFPELETTDSKIYIKPEYMFSESPRRSDVFDYISARTDGGLTVLKYKKIGEMQDYKDVKGYMYNCNTKPLRSFCEKQEEYKEVVIAKDESSNYFYSSADGIDLCREMTPPSDSKKSELQEAHDYIIKEDFLSIYLKLDDRCKQ